MADFTKPYDPKGTEEHIYKLWLESGFFTPENLPSFAKATEGKALPRTEPFTIMMPPPNVTGTLHVGHALMLVIQDILIRFERMRGKKTLWLPGVDHAAIATQAKVEELLYKKEEKTKQDLGREEFLRRVEAFAAGSHDTIVHQIKRMGSSCDWTREAYTLDEARSLAVRTAFKRMYDDGLIYRGSRIVNWDPKLQTTVSDEEIEWKEEKTAFYYITYGPFTIATARPETKFGDKYVVMHPDDARYQQYRDGQKLEVEWINGKIMATVIKDPVIDMEFGTGVMTITPWHDATDFEISKRHKLESEQIIDFNGKLLPIAGEFAGMHIKKARPLIVEKLKEKGLLVKIEEEYAHRIATNSRGGGVIEPQIKLQWFVDVNKEFIIPDSHINSIASGGTVTLKKLMRTVVENGQIKILPERFEKTYFHWIDNLRDWCISRQIWYGHRIPVWYRPKADQLLESEDSSESERPGAGQEIYCGVDAPAGGEWRQDPDTLDTWFSSGLWTFSTLGWPSYAKATEGKPDLEVYHPTDVLETGYDILFFWVARMILMTTYHLGDVPFRTVYLHGLVRDVEKQKMSKSKGNIVNPLDMIEKFGTDALRMALIVGNTPGMDLAMSQDKIKGYKHFANKIWNAARFVLGNTQGADIARKPAISAEDQKILEELASVTKEVTLDMEEYRLYLAAEKIYHYFWHTFADIIIEEAKPKLRSENAAEKLSAQWMLTVILSTSLKLLHPFMPFVTEAVWTEVSKNERPASSYSNLLMIQEWPH